VRWVKVVNGNDTNVPFFLTVKSGWRGSLLYIIIVLTIQYSIGLRVNAVNVGSGFFRSVSPMIIPEIAGSLLPLDRLLCVLFVSRC
jgi:hypothetical protein